MHLLRSWALIFAFALAAAPASAVPILTTGIFGSPGQASQFANPATPDGGFTAAGGSTIESFGFEGLPGQTGQRLRLNALTAPNTFTFSVASSPSFVFVSGREYSFTESYSGDATKQVNVQVVDTTTSLNVASLVYTANYGNIQSLIVRQRVRNSATSNDSVTFRHLALAGTNFSDVITLNSTAGMDLANYFQISNFDFTGAWTLSGIFSASWTAAPSGSSMGFQVKAWQSEVAVAEPGTAALLAAGLFGMAGLRRRRAA